MKQFSQHLFGFLVFLVLISFGFSAGYYIIQLLHLDLSEYLRHMAAMVVGFLILGLIGYFIHFFGRSKQRRFYDEVIDALKRIANGDFNVYLDFKIDRRHEFAALIDHFNHMAKQLKEIEEMRQEFISNVSHEIQSPLTSIVGFARALQGEGLTKEERSHYLNIIETESKRLSRLSDNLLKLTALESDHQRFEQKTYRLDQQIRSIILACEPNWMEKELDMDIELDKVTIFADEALMSQVWTNLIHNSIKFTSKAGTIRVRLQQNENQAVVKISDTGIGISKEDQVHIFERFYKADKARERSKGGNGLGLSIVKKIIEMHHGSILVESTVGKGTTFTILLPLSLTKG